uniref:Uncharacterized protein n=1 Tax=Prymnesium polylepis TaxID=72548 RepID=A0A7S4HD88_9EUKA|mmetsp:Transcript_11916/g.29943  ORF Transcript_11916/g.29943 Transcript_11916/m.29943 type:complete len:117 (+) Transcript_11916:51-401(+)
MSKTDEGEVVIWRSQVGPDGMVSGVMQAQVSEVSGEMQPQVPKQPEPTRNAEPEEETSEEQQPQRGQRSTLLDGIERKQTMIDGGSTIQIAAVVGGQAINRYGQILARVDQPEDVA